MIDVAAFAAPLTDAEKAVRRLFADECGHEPNDPCLECDARGRHIVGVVGPIIQADTLEQLSRDLENLPRGGESLKGPYWYRQGVEDAAVIARDKALKLHPSDNDEQKED